MSLAQATAIDANAFVRPSVQDEGTESLHQGNTDWAIQCYADALHLCEAVFESASATARTMPAVAHSNGGKAAATSNNTATNQADKKKEAATAAAAAAAAAATTNNSNANANANANLNNAGGGKQQHKNSTGGYIAGSPKGNTNESNARLLYTMYCRRSEASYSFNNFGSAFADAARAIELSTKPYASTLVSLACST